MKRNLIVALFLALLTPVFLSAQTTGKLRGKVIDKETGEALPGANVTVEGTNYGAATDVNGEYIILNVPAGVYAVKASFIGYRDVTISNILVNSGLTKEVNFELPTEALEGTAVEIVAERPLVNKNATNAVRIQSYEEIKNVPVRGIPNIIALQPGVVQQNGVTYIRGGRSDEVGYYLEGASTRSVMSGGNTITVIPEALQELQVQAGGYTAEFGGANAGIIRQTLKTGSENYHFMLQGETDNFADTGEQFLNTYSYGYSDYTMTASGPVPGVEKLRFFVAGQNIFRRDRIQRFWNGFDFQHADTYVDENNFPLTITRLPNTEKAREFEKWLQDTGISTPDGNIQGTSSQNWIGNGTLVYDANPYIIRVGGALSFSRSEGSGTNVPARIFNLDRIGQNDASTGLLNVKFTHLINPTTFYEVNFNYFDQRSVSYDPLFKDVKHNFWAYWDSTANAERGVYFDRWENPRVGPFGTFDVNGFNFTFPGTPAGYGKSKRGYIGGSFALTTQRGNHEIKFGGDLQSWTVRQYGIGARTMFITATQFPDRVREAAAGVDSSVAAFRAQTFQNFTYGYDAFGNEINTDDVNGPRNPKFMSAYVQDKFELSDLVINAGIRVDVMDNDDFIITDPSNPPWDQNGRGLDESKITRKDAIVEISPRIGLAFPVTDRTVFHMQYGKFVQSPSLNNLYGSDAYYNNLFLGRFSIQSPVGFNLEPEKTIQYEIGFSQQFTDAAAFDVTFYYKNIDDQLQISRFKTSPTSSASDYNVLVNGDFATTSGVELSMTLRRTNRVSAQINYTYARSKGTGSVSNTAVSAIELGSQVPTLIFPLDFEQKHRGSINFDYRFGKDDGGFLEQTGLNLLATFNSGHPYTLSTGGLGQQDESFGGQITDPRSRIPLENINASYTPWNFQLDLRLDRTFNIAGFNANAYVYIQNLTNRKNVINVYRRTGNAYDDGFLSNYELSGSIIENFGGQAFVDMYRAINLGGNGTNYSRDTGQMLLGTPRIIRLGLRLEY